MEYSIKVEKELVRCGHCNRGLDLDSIPFSCPCGAEVLMEDGELRVRRNGLPTGFTLAGKMFWMSPVLEIPETLTAAPSCKKEDLLIIEKDGSAWCAHDGWFEDPQVSDCSFGSTPEEALKSFLELQSSMSQSSVVPDCVDRPVGRESR